MSDYIKKAEKSMMTWENALKEIEKADKLSEREINDLHVYKANTMKTLDSISDKTDPQFLKLRERVSRLNRRMVGALNDPR